MFDAVSFIAALARHHSNLIRISWVKVFPRRMSVLARCQRNQW
jgi:hypothetical protein